MQKKCGKCKEFKDVSCFYKNKQSKDGLAWQCKICAAKYQKEKRAWHKYFKNHPDQLVKRKKYRNLNKEKHKEYSKEWRLRNKNYSKERYHNNPQRNLHVRLGNRLRDVLRKQTIKKSIKIKELIGITGDELVIYIESLFTDGMTWDRFFKGEIHIDHIIPCCLFNLEDIEEQKKCFHYTNLQPLWAKDNLSKNKKYFTFN
jgi:hypothetical protein